MNSDSSGYEIRLFSFFEFFRRLRSRKRKKEKREREQTATAAMNGAGCVARIDFGIENHHIIVLLLSEILNPKIMANHRRNESR